MRGDGVSRGPVIPFNGRHLLDDGKEFTAPRDLDFGKDVGHMKFHSGFRDIKDGGDFFIGKTMFHKFHHGEFTFGKFFAKFVIGRRGPNGQVRRVGCRAGVVAAPDPLNGIDQSCGDFRICNESGHLLRDTRRQLLLAMLVPDQEDFCNGKENSEFSGAAKKRELVHQENARRIAGGKTEIMNDFCGDSAVEAKNIQ